MIKIIFYINIRYHLSKNEFHYQNEGLRFNKVPSKSLIPKIFIAAYT